MSPSNDIRLLGVASFDLQARPEPCFTFDYFTKLIIIDTVDRFTVGDIGFVDSVKNHVVSVHAVQDDFDDIPAF